ncbi:MAG: HAD family hydrolase [Myxococcota bacterium]|nr:HAD family hydrolase [Myxococcota bacterium]
MDLLVLDFDGVISDSAPEAFEVARRSYLALRPDSRIAALADDALYRRFLELMPLGNRAEDYGTALAAVEDDVELPDQPAYDAFRAAQDAGWLRTYHRTFYRVRDAFRESEPERWLALIGPYPELIAILRRRAGACPYAIATSKDRRSVRVLLREYGIDDLFDEGSVLDKETGVRKTAHIEHLAERLAVPPERMTFVDDKVNHLDPVAALGVRCALAAWGYNGPREAKLAREHGHLVCGLDDVERALFD